MAWMGPLPTKFRFLDHRKEFNMQRQHAFCRFRILGALAIVGAVWPSIGSMGTAAETAPVRHGPDPKLYQATVDLAVSYLTSRQSENGSISPQVGNGPTAIAMLALMRSGRSPADPAVAKGLKWLEGFVQLDGAISSKESMYPNYETSLALACFAEANRDGRYAAIIKNAEKYLKANQWTEEMGQDPSKASYGGAGYGKHKRPDLSNTQFFLDALKAAGVKPDDEAVKKALIFVSRCQNLESEHNTLPFPAKNPDGGFYYTCAAGGTSQAGQTPDGGLRSYGSMTYAGLKSMLYANVGRDDPRVKAAVKWIQLHYDLSSNPGLGDAGLYYYYHTFAKALDALGDNEFTDAKGIKHDWRRELTEIIAKKQKNNGAWVNTNSKWMEDDPNLATSFALLALTYCRPVAGK
jgi:squalene-hopene/tetraprenyl-beta-curcumene cyclase